MNFEDIEIPTEIEETFYVCICINSEWGHNIGRIQTSIYDYSTGKYSSVDDKHVLLATKKVKIKIPKVIIDFRGEIVSSLEAQKEKELAEHHMKMKAFQDKIDNLLAIECKPEEKTA